MSASWWRVGLAALVLATAMPTAAAAASFDPTNMVFPVVGESSMTDSFGDPRSGGRTHEGVDIMASKGQEVVAVADGRVAWIGDACCDLAIDHGDGWQTWYIHLNNDSPGTDDGLGWGIAEGIVEGAEVRRGQLIGWVGDSGNAEEAGSHLHFELRRDGVAIDPYEYLLSAQTLSYAATGYSGQFRDDDGSVHEPDIDRLALEGITRGCNAAGDLFCPHQEITRGEMAAFIRRTLGLPSTGGDFFHDDDGHQFEDDIDTIVAAGIGFGCDADHYCPDAPLRREEMAELLVRAFAVPGVETDHFADDQQSPFEPAIDALREVGITKGCDSTDPTRFCPDRHLTRAEMASFFIRSLDWKAAQSPA